MKTYIEIQNENKAIQVKLKGILKRSGRNLKWFHETEISPVFKISYQNFTYALRSNSEMNQVLKDLIEKYFYRVAMFP